jgi:hypothetical protein
MQQASVRRRAAAHECREDMRTMLQTVESGDMLDLQEP